MTTEETTVKVVTNRERISGVVQAVGRRPSDIERRWWESAAIFAAFTLLYGLIGYWLVARKHLIGFETLDRFDRGLMIWHNDPQKLSAVGFDYPPLTVLLLAPFTIVPSLARSMVVIPIVSALFAAFIMVTLNTMMRRAQVIFPVRLAVLAAIGLNPLVVMYASTGARNFMWLSFVIAALGGLMAWYVTADIRFVMVAGLAFAVAALTGYGSLAYFLVAAIMVAGILARLGADGTEVEGTSVGFAAPTVYVIALWSLFCLILLFRPLAWLTESSDTAASGGLGDFGFADIITGTGQLVLYGAPIAIVVLPALIFAGISRRNGFALWLGVMLLVAILLPGLAVLLRLTDSPMTMANALPILLVALAGAIWLARSFGTGSNLVALLTAGGLALSIPWTFAAMNDFQYQGLESNFHNAISTGDSQEGKRTLDGSVVGIDKERDMADWIRANVDEPNSILTDNAQTFGAIFFTGDPALFFDRVDEGDENWTEAARNPADHVRYMLLSTDVDDDQLSTLYPQAAVGNDPSLPVAYDNSRYVLVEVPEGYVFGETSADAETGDDDSGSGTSGSGATNSGDCASGTTNDPGGVGGVIGEAGSDGDNCESQS